MAGSRGTSAVWFVPAVVTLASVPGLFFLGMRSDPPEVRAGAEPVMSGIVYAAPFVWLGLFHLAGGLWAVSAASRSGRRNAVVAMTVMAVLVAGLLVRLLGQGVSGKAPAAALGFAALLGVAVLLPLVPAWRVLRRPEAPAA